MDEIYEDVHSCEKSFIAKWGRKPDAYGANVGMSDSNLIQGRVAAIESLVEIFEAIGDENRARMTSALLSEFREYSGGLY
jgi:hypothetical protein